MSDYDLREARDRSGDRDRSRERGRGRGSIIDYYEDLGMSTTKEGYGAWKEGEAKYSKEVSNIQSQIDKAQGQYNEAAKKGPGEVPSYRSLYDKAWSDFRRKEKFIPVRIVDGNKIEGSYMLPTSTAKMLESKLSKAYHTNRQGSWMNIDVDAKGGGGKRGQELHDIVRGAEQTYQREFKKAADKQIYSAINTAKKQVAANQSALDSSLANINQSRDQLSSQKKVHDDTLQGYKTDYQDRLKRVAESIGGFKVARK